MKNRTNKGIIDEAGDLYNQLYGEARRLAERDKEAARRRGPMAKALIVACFVAGVVAAVTLAYGFITFPDAPLREVTNGYVGKHGAPRTREDYEIYKLWQTLVVASFGLAFLAGLGAVVAEKMSKRKHGE